MNKDIKFCSNCGEELPADIRFCTECGYDFEEQTVPNAENNEEVVVPTNVQVNNEGEATTASKFDFKNFDMKNFDVKNLEKKHWAIIGGVIALIALVIFLFSGNVSIAGTYESENTLMDPQRSEIITISRNGKATLLAEEADGSGGEMVIQLEEYEGFPSEYSPSYGEDPSGMAVYRVDSTEGIEIEMTVFSDGSSGLSANNAEMNMVAEMFGLNIDIEGNYVTIAGKITSAQAYAMDLDFSEFEVVEQGAGRLLIDNDMYIEQ